MWGAQSRSAPSTRRRSSPWGGSNSLPSREVGWALAPGGDRGYFQALSACSLRLAAQDVALSRRKQGFESPRERQRFQYVRLAKTRAPAMLPIFLSIISSKKVCVEEQVFADGAPDYESGGQEFESLRARH